MHITLGALLTTEYDVIKDSISVAFVLPPAHLSEH
jgi:hypothetical protein